MSYLAKAINKIRPSAEFSFTDEDYLTIQWNVLEGKAPTEAEIDAAIKQVKADEAQAELDKARARQVILDRLGITADEAVLLLG